MQLELSEKTNIMILDGNELMALQIPHAPFHPSKCGSAFWIIYLCIYTLHIANQRRGVCGIAIPLSDKYRSSSSPCRYTTDKNYMKGIVTDCTNLGLTWVNSSWIPLESTTLLLNGNRLESIDKGLFSHAINLRKIEIRDNNMIKLDGYSFEGLKYLERLDLEYNKIRLDRRVIDGRVFQRLENLLDLRLAYNENENIAGQYPTELFLGLTKLRYVSLDTFAGDLYLGDVFRTNLKLTSLRLVGGVSKITNQTFQDFEAIPLESLTISHVDYLTEIELGAFSYLNSLHQFRLENTYLGVSKSLLSLYPFQNRKFTSIMFTSVEKNMNEAGKLGVYDTENAKFLKTICVKNFALTHSHVLYIRANAINFDLWGQCLESFDSSDNPYLGETQFFWNFYRLKKLKQFFMKRCKKAMYRTKVPDRKWFESACNRLQTVPTRMDFKNDKQLAANTFHQLDKYAGTANNVSGIIHSTATYQGDVNGRTITYHLPQGIERFVFSSCAEDVFSLEDHIRIIGASSLRELDLSDNGITKFTGTLEGFSNVIRLDFSYNDGSIMSPRFLDTFPEVKMLNIAGIALDAQFIIEYCERLFRKLTKLQVLDISNNQLAALSPLCFQQNSHLVLLNLNKNKFENIPVDLKRLPRLVELHMEENSISYLDNSDISTIENHFQKVSSFRIFMRGNLFLCDCHRIRFLAWLQRTQVDLYDKNSFMCLNENGKLVKAVEGRDMNVMWRMCVGKDAFFLSLILCVLMILSFLIFILCIRSSTLIKAYIFQTFSNNFNLKKMEDYEYGGFIGYAAADSTFACLILREFIEESLNITTYIRDRDLIPSSNMAESIVDAVNSSWRLVFITTPDFLHNDEWAYFAMKTAAYSVTPANARRIILLVDRKCLHEIPRSILRCVHEENIIVLEKPFRLDHALRAELKAAFSAVSHG